MKIFSKVAYKYGPLLIKNIGQVVNPLILKFKQENSNLLIFYFHGLFEDHHQKKFNHMDPQTNMTTKEFENFLDYFINAKYKFISPEDLPFINNDEAHAMITFDDGYFNNKLAINILNKYRIPGTFFLSTRNIVENKSYWWDIIYKYRFHKNYNLEKIRAEQVSLKKLRSCEIDDYLIKNFGKDCFTPWSDLDRPFNEKEVSEIAKDPLVFIGNHTHTHAILTNCTKEEIISELEISNRILTRLTNKQPISVAYPNGNYNNTILELAEKSGFKYGFTTESGINFKTSGLKKCINFKRNITGLRDISKFGTFRRLGYEPEIFYNHLIKKSKDILKLKK